MLLLESKVPSFCDVFYNNVCDCRNNTKILHYQIYQHFSSENNGLLLLSQRISGLFACVGAEKLIYQNMVFWQTELKKPQGVSDYLSQRKRSRPNKENNILFLPFPVILSIAKKRRPRWDHTSVDLFMSITYKHNDKDHLTSKQNYLQVNLYSLFSLFC